MREAIWPGLADARRRQVRDAFTHSTDPEWVRRIAAAKEPLCKLEGELAARRLSRAIDEAVDYVNDLARAHEQGDHEASPQVDCEACTLVLSAEELLREHRGW